MRTKDLLTSADPAGGDYTLMPCDLGAARESHAGIAGIANPKDPVMSCNAASVKTEFDALVDAARHPTQNYFIGLRPKPYDESVDYPGGCISEHAEWDFLCGDQLDPNGPPTVAVANSQREFGKLFCACRDSAAGAGCEVGCGKDVQGTVSPINRLLKNRSVEFGEVSGFWMCAGSTATTNGILQQNVNPAAGFRLVGGVVPEVISTTPLCQTAGNCGTGFKISAPAH